LLWGSSCCPSSTAPSLFFSWSVVSRDLHSFPTRRSSDLDGVMERWGDGQVKIRTIHNSSIPTLHHSKTLPRSQRELRQSTFKPRSEEHTSELQSRGHLVCRLLLEKTNTHAATSLTHRDSP